MSAGGVHVGETPCAIPIMLLRAAESRVVRELEIPVEDGRERTFHECIMSGWRQMLLWSGNGQ